jgi:hypothetical protein
MTHTHTHTVTITDPREPDAMPLWESFDHATAEDAYRAAAHGHIAATRPDDRIVGQADSVYAVLTAADLNATRVATVVITLGEDPDAAPSSIAEETPMYALTIDDHGQDVSTLHDTPEVAQAALHTYLVLSDYYHRPTQLSAPHAAFELLSLAEAKPRVVGVATIEPYSELDASRDLKAVFDASRVHALAS